MDPVLAKLNLTLCSLPDELLAFCEKKCHSIKEAQDDRYRLELIRWVVEAQKRELLPLLDRAIKRFFPENDWRNGDLEGAVGACPVVHCDALDLHGNSRKYDWFKSRLFASTQCPICDVWFWFE